MSEMIVKGFGLAPILREGEAVKWGELDRELDRDNYEYEVEVKIDGAEEINE
jgi:hypothetical protein